MIAFKASVANGGRKLNGRNYQYTGASSESGSNESGKTWCQPGDNNQFEGTCGVRNEVRGGNIRGGSNGISSIYELNYYSAADGNTQVTFSKIYSINITHDTSALGNANNPAAIGVVTYYDGTKFRLVVSDACGAPCKNGYDFFITVIGD